MPVSATTERVFNRLPEHYRTADAVHGDTLLGYLSLEGDQLGELSDLVDTLGADLTDPATTPAAALNWLAQFVGERLMPLMTDAEKRATIALHQSWSSGTVLGIIGALQAVLTGTKRVTVVQHWDGNGLLIAVWTYAAESPAPAVVQALLLTQKPAGIGLVDTTPVKPGMTWYDAAHQYATWGALAAAFATWGDAAAAVPTYDQGY